MVKTEVSFIVPVYRVHDYLASCLDSLLSQDCSFPYNIILVETGSDDESNLICKEYEEKYPEKVFYFHYPSNHGISVARNLGLLYANGRYVSFVDGDDVLAPDFLSSLFEEVSSHPDIPLVIGSYLIREEDGKERRIRRRKPEVCSGKKALGRLLLSIHHPIDGYCWGKLYLRKFLLSYHLFFDEKMKIYEDFLFLGKVLLAADQVSFVPRESYFYCQHASSTMHQAKDTLSYRLEALQGIRTEMEFRDPRLLRKFFSSPGRLIRRLIRDDCQRSASFYQKNPRQLYHQIKKDLQEIYHK